MNIGKNRTRANTWPSVSSIIYIIGGPYDGEWAVVHRFSRAVVLDANGDHVVTVRRRDVPDWDLFRVGSRGYGSAWRAPLPWMERTR